MILEMIKRMIAKAGLQAVLLTCRRLLLAVRPHASADVHERLARDLFFSNRLDEAQAVYRGMTDRFQENTVGHLGLAMVAHARDDPATAERHWQAWEGQATDRTRDASISRRVRSLVDHGLEAYALKLGLQLLESHRSSEAKTALSELLALSADTADVLRALMQVARYEEVPGEELALLDQLLAKEPHNRALKVRRCGLLRELGRVEESDALIHAMREEMPDDVRLAIELARNATEARDYVLATERWAALSTGAPANVQIQTSYIQSLLDNVEFDRAQQQLDLASKKLKRRQVLSIQVDIYRARAEWEKAVEAADELCRTDHDQLPLQRKRANLLLSMYRKFHDPALLESCLETARRLMLWKPDNFGNRIFLIQVLLLSGSFDEAVAEIDRLPAINSERVMRLRAWRMQREGDVQAAKEIWSEIQRVHHVPQTAALDEVTLERRDENRLSVAPDEITAYSVVRNERWRLPWFLSYYRSLGVDRFIFVDNDSNDGTREYLLEQPDVHVFWTDGSYAKAYSGMRWVNHLVEQYGDDAWCMYVDVDEAFVFAGVETASLKDLTTYMKSRGHEALFAFMVDMFADDESPPVGADETTDFFAQYPLFDNYYKRLPSIYCPWYYVAGGARRKLGYHENQTKTPIIRGGKGIRFLMSSHCITPAVLSDVSGAMLHFKLAGAYGEAFEADVDSNTRMPYCKQRHAAYARCLEDHDGKIPFVDGNAVRYESSVQLLELGLLHAPDEFLSRAGMLGTQRPCAKRDGRNAPRTLRIADE